MGIWKTYGERLVERDRLVRTLDGRAARIASLRLLVAVGMVVLVGAIVWAPLPLVAWWAVAGFLVLFVALVIVHARVFERKARALSAHRFYERALGRRDGRWQSSPFDGARFLTPDHPYASDLDIFGRASLFQLLDSTETRAGEEHLAALLSKAEHEDYPALVRERQRAVEDLASRLDFREALSVAGRRVGPGDVGKDRGDPNPFLEWAEGRFPFSPSPALVFAAWALPVLAIVLFAFAPLFGWPRSTGLLVVLVEFAILGRTAGTLGPGLGVVAAQERSFARYAEMLELVEREPFRADLLLRAKQRLGASGHSATDEMKVLSRVLGFLDARGNEVFRIFVAPILLWDVHCGIALERWRARVGKVARDWLDVLGELEALASVGAFAAERPDFAFPELDPAPKFVAEGLGHPLLVEDRRVGNDVNLPEAGRVLVVTGSNMSGKSTLLRAIGVNAVLALAGAPVCAKRMVIGPVHVATSMRIKDSLEAGVSHFYAEVETLKRVLELTRRKRAVLFLLDEILHGTNSRERLIGARSVVTQLLERGALGAVSTHDLGLSDLEERLPGKAKNVHFQEQVVGERMTFDYRLREGLVQSSNALRLMRMVGIDVPLDG